MWRCWRRGRQRGRGEGPDMLQQECKTRWSSTHVMGGMLQQECKTRWSSTHDMGDSLMTMPQFPRLDTMTRQYMTVPVISASPERLFTSVGLVKSDSSSATPQTQQTMWYFSVSVSHCPSSHTWHTRPAQVDEVWTCQYSSPGEDTSPYTSPTRRRGGHGRCWQCRCRQLPPSCYWTIACRTQVLTTGRILELSWTLRIWTSSPVLAL